MIMFDFMTQIIFTIGKSTDNMIRMLGTGFLIPGTNYIVAPRHVVGDNDSNLGLILPSLKSFDEYQDTTITNCQFAKINIVTCDPFRDITLLKCDYFKPNSQMKDVITLGCTDDVSVGEEILIVGFPHCTEGRRVLTLQKAYVGAKVLLNSKGIKSKFCIINTQTRPGQSGSMIFFPKKNIIIAMLIGAFSSNSGISLGGINPRELHQTTQCVSAEYISSFLGERI